MAKAIRLPLRYIEIFFGRTKGSGTKSYFLYEGGECYWRTNWRGISGFMVRTCGFYITFCAWRQEGVYVKPQWQRDAENERASKNVN